MGAKGSYYLILFVYIFLWSCQLVACHLTHSLIILTDSYINLYKILDISLGILHLQTQQNVRRRSNKRQQKSANNSDDLSDNPIILFDRICTYQFKRLPLLGSFVNGLFLAALLMSAAIEGIQTCFHASHLVVEGEQSILLAHPLTYPGLLIGFALVGLVMQWCSYKSHEIRDEELGSESLFNLRKSKLNNKHKAPITKELNVSKLSQDSNEAIQANLKFESFPPTIFDNKQQETNNSLGSRALSFCFPLDSSKETNKHSKKKFTLNSSKSRHRSFECVPIDSFGGDDRNSRSSQISLKSLKYSTNLESSPISIQAITGPYNLQKTSTSLIDIEQVNAQSNSKIKEDKWWLVLIRYCISPVALIACALIVYFINQELITEIADATLAILVVSLLFTASYPPMKRAGRVLLQTAPDEVDVERLKVNLKSTSPLIVDIKELHVWSLTPTSNRIATCEILLDKDKFESKEQLSVLIQEIKYKFLDYNIKCSTIQPNFVENQKTAGCTSTSDNHQHDHL